MKWHIEDSNKISQFNVPGKIERLFKQINEKKMQAMQEDPCGGASLKRFMKLIF